MYLSQKAFNITVLPNIIFGVNSVERNLSSKIKEYGKSNVFLATDRGLVESGIVEKIVSLLEKSNIKVVVFSDVEREPSANTVMKGADVYKKENCDILVAIGGGSPMDFAKAVGTIVSHPGHILDYRLGKESLYNKTPLLFSIPTTVGTGSEVTPVSVISDSDVGKKYVIISPLIVPTIAFIDPTLTESLPRHVVAATAIDALVHAVEAYTSVNANPISDGLSIQAIKMLQKYLPESYAHPENIEARSQIHLASTIAGIAFGNAGVSLVHSCSHPMSAHYNVPHGLANAVLLPYVIDHNLMANYERYADIARMFEPSLKELSDNEAAEKLTPLLKKFTHLFDIPENFSYLDKLFTDEMIDELATDAMNDLATILNNPRKVYKEDVVEIYHKVLPLGAV